MKSKRITLKEALAKSKLEQFIKEHDGETYNPAAFNKAIAKLVGKSKAVPATSAQDSSANCSGKKTRRRKRPDA